MVEFFGTPLHPVEVFMIIRRCLSEVVGFVSFNNGKVVAAFAGHGRESVVALYAVDVVVAHNFEHQRKHKVLHLGVEGVHPFKAVFGGQAALCVERYPMGFFLQQNAAVFAVARRKSKLEPGNYLNAIFVRLVYHFLQGVAARVFRIECRINLKAGKRFHYLRTIHGHCLVPGNHKNGVQSQLVTGSHSLFYFIGTVKGIAGHVGKPHAPNGLTVAHHVFLCFIAFVPGRCLASCNKSQKQ